VWANEIKGLDRPFEPVTVNPPAVDAICVGGAARRARTRSALENVSGHKTALT